MTCAKESRRPARLLPLAVFIFLCLASVVGAQSLVTDEARIALVIGNADYANVPLKNPTNDARDVAAALRNLGFAVTLLVDADFPSMNRAIRDFGNAIKRPDAVALFYFSGHGVQYQGANYLVPTRADVQSPDELAFSAINAEQVYAKMESSGARTNIIILDACRNNPFPGAERAMERGLAVVANVQPPRSLIVYATAPGKTAQDGDGRNGVFTAALLKHFGDPGLDAELMIRRVRDDVIAATSGAQVPWHNSSITGGGFFFAGKGEISVSTDPSGADIIVDGERRGTSPIDLTDLPRYAEIEITAKLGTKSATRKVSLRDTPSLNLSMSLEAAKGSLAVQASEPFSSMLLDGAAIAAGSSGSLEGLDAGSHVLELRGESSVFKGEVTVAAGITTTVKATLMPVGSLVLNLPPMTSCTLEGMGIKDTTARKDYGQLPAGDYVLTVTGGDYDPCRETVTITRGQRCDFTPQLRFTAAYLNNKYCAELDSLAFADKRSYVEQVDIDQVAAFEQRVTAEDRKELQPLIARAEELRTRLVAKKTQTPQTPSTPATGATASAALPAKGPEILFASYSAELAQLETLQRSELLSQADIDKVSAFTLKVVAQPYQDFQELAARSKGLEAKLADLKTSQDKLAPYRKLVADRAAAQTRYQKALGDTKGLQTAGWTSLGLGAASALAAGCSSCNWNNPLDAIEEEESSIDCSLVAGTAGTSGTADGTGAAAQFSVSCGGICTDGTNLYVADEGNFCIRKIVIASRVVTTLAGSDTQGVSDGTGTSASFYNPEAIAKVGNKLVIADDQVFTTTTTTTGITYPSSVGTVLRLLDLSTLAVSTQALAPSRTSTSTSTATYNGTTYTGTTTYNGYDSPGSNFAYDGSEYLYTGKYIIDSSSWYCKIWYPSVSINGAVCLVGKDMYFLGNYAIYKAPNVALR